MHESLYEFKFRPETTTDSRVICPCTSEKVMHNVVNTLAPLFLIGSSSYWQVTRTSITIRTSSKFYLINLILAGKEDMNPHTLIMGEIL